MPERKTLERARKAKREGDSLLGCTSGPSDVHLTPSPH